MNEATAIPDPDPGPGSLLVKRLAGVLVTLALVFFALPAFAQTGEWSLTRFGAVIDVYEDGIVRVEETVTADFHVERHGIFRYVPFRGTLDDGTPYRIDVDLVGVTDAHGDPYQVKESRRDGNIVWRIGDPDVTLTGEHVYVFRYDVMGAIRRFDTHDELYWNVTGEGWDVPLPTVRASVTYPSLPKDEVRSTCYHGPRGSTDSDRCLTFVSGERADFATLDPEDPLTVAVGWPKGHIGAPSFLMRLRWFLRSHWYVVLPFLVFVGYYAAWRKRGKDESGIAIVPEYEPPDGLRPAQVLALRSQHAASKVLAPTIIDLAVRGYLEITEIEKKGFFGKKDHKLTQLKPADDTLEEYERYLLKKLFDDGETVKVSDLKNTFYKHVSQVTGKVMSSLMDRKLFDAHPNKVRGKWIVLGLLGIGMFAGLAFWLSAAGAGLWITLAVSAALVIGFGWFMPRWTKQGAAAARHAKGFEMAVKKVERYRTKWLEDVNRFEEVLPYAMAFGLGEKWAKAFEGLRVEPPRWYHPPAGRQAALGAAAWDPVGFEKSLSSMTRSFSTAATSRPGSSGGSGGGGFSGGGFGGGGGGSW